MDAAAGLAAPLVCVDLGPLPEPARAAPLKPKVNPAEAGLIIIPTAAEIQAASQPEPEVKGDPTFESSVDAALAELGRRADRYSVILAFRSDLSSYAALDRAIRAADCPWFGVDLDPVADPPRPLADRRDLRPPRPLTRHVRARDAVVGQDKRTKPAPVGQGSTELGTAPGPPRRRRLPRLARHRPHRTRRPQRGHPRRRQAPDRPDGVILAHFGTGCHAHRTSTLVRRHQPRGMQVCARN